jgi:hypothetical protein
VPCLGRLSESGRDEEKDQCNARRLEGQSRCRRSPSEKSLPKIPAYEGINNLWRYEIDREMRATYTVKREGDLFTVRVIEIFPDHKRYERRFGY